MPRRVRRFEELLAELRSPRVVISGGEPFIYPQLPDLVGAVEGTGRRVSIETSGAFWREVPAPAWVTLSPKQHVSPRYPVISGMWDRADEVKLVIETGEELAFYRSHLVELGEIPVFLQPEWTRRDRTLPMVLDLLKRFPRYRLSVQLHKYIGVG